MNKNKNWEKVKIQDSIGKTYFFISALPFCAWVFLATWLHTRALQKNT
jgi:hypothetical protein